MAEMTTSAFTIAASSNDAPSPKPTACLVNSSLFIQPWYSLTL
jgi:hypothetical protein